MIGGRVVALHRALRLCKRRTRGPVAGKPRFLRLRGALSEKPRVARITLAASFRRAAPRLAALYKRELVLTSLLWSAKPAENEGERK